jgi:hypothetical protein
VVGNQYRGQCHRDQRKDNPAGFGQQARTPVKHYGIGHDAGARPARSPGRLAPLCANIL